MYKVMIVDDEVYITVLISKLVNWSEFGMKIEEICHSGEEAYQRAQTEKFDLIILDVRMPGIDGISLMEKLRSTYQETRFIVISGHRSFDFVRGAMQNDAEDYLLKPINRDELASVLRRTKEKLDSKRNDREQLMRTNRERERMDMSLHCHALEYMMNANQSDNAPDLDYLKNHFNVYLDKKCFLTAMFVFDRLPAENWTMDETLISTISDVLNEKMTGVAHEILFTLQHNTMPVLINYEEGRLEEALGALRASQLRMNEILDHLEHSVVTLCIGYAFHLMSDLMDSFSAVNKCAAARISLGIGECISESDVPRNEGVVDTLFAGYAQLIYDAIHSFRIESLTHYVREMLANADALRNEDALICWKLARRVLQMMYEYLQSLELLSETSYDQFCESAKSRLYSAYTSQMMIRVILDFIKDKLEVYESQQMSGNRAEIRISELYIREHYMDAISLSDVASIVNYNPIYFSMTFKRETGIGFSDYLTQVRIREARKLLKDVSLTVSDVAARCGFENAKYFSQVFRKNVGITPTEYRKRHINMESSSYETEV